MNAKSPKEYFNINVEIKYLVTISTFLNNTFLYNSKEETEVKEQEKSKGKTTVPAHKYAKPFQS